jgi:hypothetical protein
MKEANSDLRLFAGVQMLIALAWLALPFVIWRRPAENIVKTPELPLDLRELPYEVGLLVCFPAVMFFLVPAIGLWNHESWARRASLLMHAANGPIAGVSIFAFAALFMPGNLPAAKELSALYACLLIGPLLFVSAAFSFCSLSYLRRSDVRRSCEQEPRPFQFTLRGAFLAMTLGTVYVAAFISRSSWQDEEAIVRRFGGRVSWERHDSFATFERGISSNVAEQLGRMRHIRGLELFFASDFAHLKRMPAVRSLKVRGRRFTDDEIMILRELSQLTWLDLSWQPISDAQLKHLHKLTHLRYLDIYGTNVTRSGVLELEKALPDLEIDW